MRRDVSKDVWNIVHQATSVHNLSRQGISDKFQFFSCTNGECRPPAVATIHSDRKSDKYSSLLFQAYSFFKVLIETGMNLTMDENGIAKVIWINW